MLSGKILNKTASLNDFREIGSVDYMVGEQVQLVFMLFDPQLKIRYVPPSTSIVTVTLNNEDTTTFDKIATFVDVLDRSLNTITLSSADTAMLLGGNLLFKVDVLGDGTQILNGLIINGLRRVVVDCAC